jgi:hypothetical protein
MPYRSEEVNPLVQCHVLHFPVAHRGDPPPRRLALAHLGFRWSQWAWRRGRVALTDEAIDAMSEADWRSRVARWDRRRPTPRRRTYGS